MPVGPSLTVHGANTHADSLPILRLNRYAQSYLTPSMPASLHTIFMSPTLDSLSAYPLLFVVTDGTLATVTAGTERKAMDYETVAGFAGVPDYLTRKGATWILARHGISWGEFASSDDLAVYGITNLARINSRNLEAWLGY